MASRLFNRVIANSKCASTSGFPLQVLHSHAQDLAGSLLPSIVSLESSFSDAGDRELHQSHRRGFGIFLGPTLLITSAHVVGHVLTVYERRTPEKSDGFEHGSVCHKACIASTTALTSDGNELKTRPLAVNFANDVSVLQVVHPEGSLLPHCVLASSLPQKENVLIAVTGLDVLMGNIRAVGQKTVRAKAPWPMEDELCWIEHEWYFYGGGGPPSRSILFNSTEKGYWFYYANFWRAMVQSSRGGGWDIIVGGQGRAW